MQLGLLPATLLITLTPFLTSNSALAAKRPTDPGQTLERTVFQTGRGYADSINLRSDVAIVYGIDPGLPDRIRTWREKDYRIHVMTGVSWGNYQDYLYGRFDGINHEDEAQTDRNGNKISHGGDVYYMSPGENYGRFLCVGVQRALESGVEAIHLEEPEFWVRGGYSPGFKKEWQSYYQEPWQEPHSSPDAQWRASKLKYFLYRRALQQVFDFIQDWNQSHNTNVRCYVPTHSLLNYAHWRIVSPESSLAQLQGCDGYIAQVWTGTSRTPNVYRGTRKERTFETAFLEYGAMQNLVRATGRTVWYLNDPIEDNPNHDWEDYRTNWESTLVASLLQPEVWRYEVMPWPNRIFNGRYPNPTNTSERIPIPPAYATELQTVINALNELQPHTSTWDANTPPTVGVLVSDSLMFQRGEPQGSDPDLSHVYALALPLLKRGIPVEPVQLENAPLPNALSRYSTLLLSYHGQKPLTPDVHTALANWTRQGGNLMMIDDESDPYNSVREWWNSADLSYPTPRLHLFEKLGLKDTQPGRYPVGSGSLTWTQTNPASLARSPDGDTQLLKALHTAMPQSASWPNRNQLILRRGPFIVAAGLDESPAEATTTLSGRFINLFDPNLHLLKEVTVQPGSRLFLLDLNVANPTTPTVLAAACKTWTIASNERALELVVEGIDNTHATALLHLPAKPISIQLEGESTPPPSSWDETNHLLQLHFPNTPTPRALTIVLGPR
ncbi:MAG: hypothetical protein RI897_1913 [Verrucomicrobiota bacterium]|jgi:hypothetical protein